MTRKLRNISTREALKAFERAGGVVRRGKGSHVNIKMPNGVLITLPMRRELKIGLLKSVIRHAGLTEEEFLKLLGRK